MAVEKVKINVYMSPVMLEALKKLAVKQDRPYAQLIREACREYILTTARTMKEQRARS